MMTPADYPGETHALCETCHVLGARGWCRATSGNFSARVDATFCLITQSGMEKSQLTADDLMVCDLDGKPIDANCRPSAETPLHTRLYQLDDSIGAVLHTHSVPATLLSLHGNAPLVVSGYEMQKALCGVVSHEEEIVIPVFDNNQDMDALANLLASAWGTKGMSAPGFLIRGHGLYAWGSDLAEAKRHVEGLEFLMECKWQEKLANIS
jgi:methylthioribulose-1-phosphate dehydratase